MMKVLYIYTKPFNLQGIRWMQNPNPKPYSMLMTTKLDSLISTSNYTVTNINLLSPNRFYIPFSHTHILTP